MWQRLLLGVVAVIGLTLLGAVTALADDVGTHEGLVVSVQGNRLTMTDKDGKNQHAHIVPADTAITCDGKPCRLQDLKKGFPVKVTMEKKADKSVLTRIDATKDNR